MEFAFFVRGSGCAFFISRKTQLLLGGFSNEKTNYFTRVDGGHAAVYAAGIVCTGRCKFNCKSKARHLHELISEWRQMDRNL